MSSLADIQPYRISNATAKASTSVQQGRQPLGKETNVIIPIITRQIQCGDKTIALTVDIWGVFWYIFRRFLCWPLTLVENRLVLKTSGDLSSPHISVCQERERDRTAVLCLFLSPCAESTFLPLNAVCWLHKGWDWKDHYRNDSTHTWLGQSYLLLQCNTEG